MNISGVLVQSRPDRIAAVTDQLNGLCGVEVHQASDDGRLIVTVEDTDAKASGDTMVQISLMPGVIAASLVYHHFEPDADPLPDPVDHPALETSTEVSDANRSP